MEAVSHLFVRADVLCGRKPYRYACGFTICGTDLQPSFFAAESTSIEFNASCGTAMSG